MKVISAVSLLAAAMLPGVALAAVNCATLQQPLNGNVLVPVASELANAANPLGTPGSVLSQAYDETQSLDQVLLRIRIDACRHVAIATPGPAVIDPNDPATYKPKTEFDNTPWRFDMSQNGKRMTADAFDEWMKTRGLRVVGGKFVRVSAGTVAAPAPAIPPKAE